MAKAKIPEWFDVQNFSLPKSPEQWSANIEIRARFLEAKENLGPSHLEQFFLAFAGRLVEEFDIHSRHTNPFPVKTMSAADMAVISASWSVDEGWQRLHQKVCSVVGTQAPASVLDEVLDIYREEEVSLKGDAIEKVGWLAPAFCHGVPISVDLDADDETLKLAFSIWLAGVRDEESKQYKRSLDPEDYQKWHKFRLLAAFDIYQWAEISGSKFTNTQIANALFPPNTISVEDRDVDMGERLRKVVKPLMEQTITVKTARLINSTARLEKLLGRIVEEQQSKGAAEKTE